MTLEALIDQWSVLRLADKRESYAAEAVRAIKVAFPKQLPLPAADLDRATVVRILDGLAKDGKPAMAARTAAYGASLLPVGDPARLDRGQPLRRPPD